MTLYGQEAEVELMASFLPCVSSTYVVDVGAERGSFAAAMLEAGSERVDLIEPESGNVAYLRERFSGDDRAIVHDAAAGECDGQAMLHLSARSDGSSLSFGHTMLDRPGTSEIKWPDQASVDVRSLASLVASEEIPERVGLLKIDTEGSDLAVVRGMGSLECDVVMVEHWSDLPYSLGVCPWTSEELIASLATRGFTHYAFLLHREEGVTFRWDAADVDTGEMGNLIFLHERVLDALVPLTLLAASRLARTSSDRLIELRSAADERGALLQAAEGERGLQAAAAAERLAALERLRAERDATVEQVSRERDLQARVAAERLETLEGLQRDSDLHVAAAAERLAELEKLRAVHTSAAARIATLEGLARDHAAALAVLEHERDEQSKAALERLAMIDVIAAERDLLARVAEERLVTVRKSEQRMAALERECEVQGAAARERLATIEELKTNRDQHAAAAAERLTEIEKLADELEVQSRAAEQRRASLEILEREPRAGDLPPAGWS